MAGVNIFLLVNYIMNILPDKYFKSFLSGLVSHSNLLNYFLSIVIFWI